jgi:hypothetical protein
MHIEITDALKIAINYSLILVYYLILQKKMDINMILKLTTYKGCDMVNFVNAENRNKNPQGGILEGYVAIAFCTS